MVPGIAALWPSSVLTAIAITSGQASVAPTAGIAAPESLSTAPSTHMAVMAISDDRNS